MDIALGNTVRCLTNLAIGAACGYPIKNTLFDRTKRTTAGIPAFYARRSAVFQNRKRLLQGQQRTIGPLPGGGLSGCSANATIAKAPRPTSRMIHFSAAGKRFGARTLFEDLDWLITPQDHAGIVGANGTGKSTLLKILAGIETLDYGSMTHQKGITLGYLPQEGLSLSGRTSSPSA